MISFADIEQGHYCRPGEGVRKEGLLGIDEKAAAWSKNLTACL